MTKESDRNSKSLGAETKKLEKNREKWLEEVERKQLEEGKVGKRNIFDK